MMSKRGGSKNSHYIDGRTGTRLYRIYNNMKTRCLNPNTRSWNRYGGRGIEICSEWIHSFVSFREWAFKNGYTDDLTLDRINNDGNYEPNNCRWITVKQQSLNRSSNHLIEINGMFKPLDEWSRIYGKNPKTIRDRLARGWNIFDALNQPIDTRWSH